MIVVFVKDIGPLIHFLSIFKQAPLDLASDYATSKYGDSFLVDQSFSTVFSVPILIIKDASKAQAANVPLAIQLPDIMDIKLRINELLQRKSFNGVIDNEYMDSSNRYIVLQLSGHGLTLLCIAPSGETKEAASASFLDGPKSADIISNYFLRKESKSSKGGSGTTSKKAGSVAKDSDSSATTAAKSVKVVEEHKQEVSAKDLFIEQEKEKEKFRGEYLPTVFASIYSNQEFKPIACNSNNMIPFQTEIFEGHVLLMVNSGNPASPYNSRFSGLAQKYRMEIQVQGKFRRIPNGRIFMGAEVTKHMELGMITKAMCGTVLQIARSVNAYMHHSYGDKSGFELPHIMSPLWSTIDRLIITTPNEKPPPLGIPFDEPQDSRDRRRKDPDYNIDVDLKNTYSFSFKSSNLDLVNWNVVNIPLLGVLDLHNFWGDADIRLCSYCVPTDKEAITKKTNAGLAKFHPQSCIEYIFRLEIAHASNKPDRAKLFSPSMYVGYKDPKLRQLLIEDENEKQKQKQQGSQQMPSLSSSSSMTSRAYSDQSVANSNKLIRSFSSVSYALLEDSAMSTRPESGSASAYDSGSDIEFFDAIDDSLEGNSVEGRAEGAAVPVSRSRRHSLPDSDDEDEGESQLPLSVTNRTNEFLLASSSEDTDPDDVKARHVGETSGVSKGKDRESLDDDEDLDAEGFESDFKKLQEARMSMFARPMGGEPVSPTNSRLDNSSPRSPLVTADGIEVVDAIDSQSATPNLANNAVLGVLEVDDMRRSRQRSRRTLYAFALLPLHDIGAAYGSASAVSSAANGSTTTNRRSSKFGKFFDRVSGSSNSSGVSTGITGLSTPSSSGRPATLRTYKEWEAEFPLVDSPIKPANYSRMNESEQRRFELNVSYKEVCKQAWTDESIYRKLSKFLNIDMHLSNFLLKVSGGMSSSRLRVGLPSFTTSSLVCVQLGNSFWSEEFLGLTADELIFVKPSSRLGASKRLRLPLQSIVAVQSINPADMPFMFLGICSFVVSTFSKRYTILIRGQDAMEMWVDTLQLIITTRHVQLTQQLDDSRLMNSSFGSGGIDSSARRPSFDSMNAATINSILFSTTRHLDLLVRPKGWKLGDRLVLNARSFTSNSKVFQTDPNNPFCRYRSNPCLLVEELLKRAYKLATITSGAEAGNRPRGLSVDNDNDSAIPVARESFDNSQFIAESTDEMSVETQMLWIEFMDGLSLLHSIDLATATSPSLSVGLSEDEALALFLNLYHCLLIHAFLVMGPPASIFKYASVFNVCSYEAFGDIFTLSELEHNIIKSGLPKPAVGYLAQSFLPSSKYDFSLNRFDFRLHWAVNNGARSMISTLPLFQPHILDKQLNLLVRLSLPVQMTISSSTVTLPQFCEWHKRSFQRKQAILNQLLEYARGEQEMSICALLSKKITVSIKYSPFDYRCRMLTLYANLDEIDNEDEGL